MNKLSLGAFALLSVLFAGPAMADDIVVGAAGPMTGGQATFGRQMRDGAEQAVADINAAGGVLGRKLRLEIGDDACDPKQARSVAEKLSGMGVAVAVGHYCSSSSIPASDAYVDGNVLQITPASTNPLFTDRSLWNTFRTCGRDDQQGGFAAGYLAKNFKDKNIAIINDKTTYGKGLADEVKKALNAAGVKEKLNESYNQGDKDFTALVSKLKRDNIDIVYDGGYHQEAGLIVRQMRDQGLKTILMAGDALATREFSSITGPAGEGVLITFPPDPRKRPSAARGGEEIQGQGHRSGRVRALHLRRLSDLGAGRRQGRHHRSAKSRRDDARRHLGHRARPDLVRQKRRHHRRRLGGLSLGQGRQLRRDQRSRTELTR